MSYRYKMRWVWVKPNGAVLRAVLFYVLIVFVQPLATMNLRHGMASLFMPMLFAALPLILVFNFRRMRVVVSAQGMEFEKFGGTGRVRNFSWDQLDRIERGPLARVAKSKVLCFVLNDGHRFILGVEDKDGNPAFVPEQYPQHDATPVFYDAILQAWNKPVAEVGVLSPVIGPTDLGREAGHVTFAALGFAVAAVALMVLSNQHYMNSQDYRPELYGAAVLATLAAVRYQWRLRNKLNMLLPTLLFAATAVWCCWSLMLLVAMLIGRPVAVPFKAVSESPAGNVAMESIQRWESEGMGPRQRFVLWADPGHFRYKIGDTHSVILRVIPLLGIATVGRDAYNDMLIAGKPTAALAPAACTANCSEGIQMPLRQGSNL